ncbi:MAG: hypothetical protein ACLQU2_27380 [Candidatus Binataceae bacterium]
MKSDSSSTALDLAFSLTEGGPGTAFLKRLRLIHPELGASSARTALILMTLLWVPLCVLCLIKGVAFSGVKLPFFYDIAAHTRFLLAVPVLVLADIPVGARLRQVVRHFLVAHLVREEELTKFEAIVLDTLRFRDARVAGMTLLASKRECAVQRRWSTAGGSPARELVRSAR